MNPVGLFVVGVLIMVVGAFVASCERDYSDTAAEWAIDNGKCAGNIQCEGDLCLVYPHSGPPTVIRCRTSEWGRGCKVVAEGK